MSTRSNIGIITADRLVEMIYCHSDGYPSYNGRILLENWSNTEAVRNLMRLGDISSLGEKIGEEHDFNDYTIAQKNHWTRAYGRDRGETGIESRKKLTVAKALASMEEFLYLWDAEFGTWFYSDNGKDLKPLTLADCRD